MFSKTTNSQIPPQPSRRPEAPPLAQAQADAARRTAAKPASILSADLLFEGNISGDGELVVDGAVKGDIHVARLIIGERAHVEGTIRGGIIEVRGTVNGNIEGKAVRLLESAHVEGDITHEQLSIDVGAFFQGRCQQFRPAPAQAAPQQAVLADQTAPAANVFELEQAAH
jgi:cytoskeletal protein CcmA (bactofilin family)